MVDLPEVAPLGKHHGMHISLYSGSVEESNRGYQKMLELLSAQGLHVQEARVRVSMHRVDPHGTLLRSLEIPTTHRRGYNRLYISCIYHVYITLMETIN